MLPVTTARHDLRDCAREHITSTHAPATPGWAGARLGADRTWHQGRRLAAGGGAVALRVAGGVALLGLAVAVGVALVG